MAVVGVLARCQRVRGQPQQPSRDALASCQRCQTFAQVTSICSIQPQPPGRPALQHHQPRPTSDLDRRPTSQADKLDIKPRSLTSTPDHSVWPRIINQHRPIYRTPSPSLRFCCTKQACRKFRPKSSFPQASHLSKLSDPRGKSFAGFLFRQRFITKPCLSFCTRRPQKSRHLSRLANFRLLQIPPSSDTKKKSGTRENAILSGIWRLRLLRRRHSGGVC